ncbi:Ubiquinol oxidase 2, mitochondrial [Capsicum chinense]|nr:Ubiquinol oxidase 2, mitochondrial [Capsicum chinense]
MPNSASQEEKSKVGNGKKNLLKNELSYLMQSLEEKAIHSYTLYLNDIDCGEIENVPAPAIAIDYCKRPKDAILKDVVTVIRADKAHHRDVNHFASPWETYQDDL